MSTAATDASGPVAQQRAAGLRRLHELTQRLAGLRGVPDTVDAVATSARTLGFGVVVVNLVRSDGDLQTVFVSGNDDARDALLGSVASRDEWDRMLSVGRHYLGAIWQDHREIDLDGTITSWIPSSASADSHGWHPLDALFVPLLTADGDLLGTLSVDLPSDGHRPEDHELELLGMFGRQASLALENAQLHDSLLAREQQLATELARTQALLTAAPVAIIELDLEGRVQRWNQAAQRMLGWSQEEVLGRENPASAAAVDGGVQIEDVLTGGDVERVRLQRRTKDGRLLDVELSTSVVRDGDGVAVGVLGAMTDITEQLRQAEMLRQAAFLDPLTGCANRALLMDTLAARFADGCPTELLLVDLDRFKAVNDSHGHGVGDEVIVEASRRFGALPGSVLLARLGGDEFVLVCETAGQARHLAGAVVGEGARPISTSAGPVDIGASVGLATAVPGTDTASTLLRRADVALYAAKAAGRGCWRAAEIEVTAQRTSPSVTTRGCLARP